MQGFDTLDIIKQIIICLFHPEGWEFRSIKKKGSACFSHYIIVTKRKSSFCKLSRFLTTMEKCNSPIKWVAFSGSLHFFPCLFQFFYNDHIVFLELGKKVFSCLFLSLAGKKKMVIWGRGLWYLHKGWSKNVLWRKIHSCWDLISTKRAESQSWKCGQLANKKYVSDYRCLIPEKTCMIIIAFMCCCSSQTKE